MKTDFVLTTLAMRKQSHFFPQHIAPEAPLQHVCVFLFAWEKTSFLKYGHCLHCLAKTSKKEKNKNHFWSPETLSQRKAKGRLSHCRETQKIKQKQMHVFFSCVFIFHFLFIVSSIMFIYVHFFSLVVQCSHLFSCCSFLFISCIFLLLKNKYQSRPLACRPTTYFCWNIAFEKCIYIYNIYRWFSCFPAPTKTPFCIGSCCLLLFIIFIGMLCYAMLFFMLFMYDCIYIVYYIYIYIYVYVCVCVSLCLHIYNIYIYIHTHCYYS